jgi:hypothetical protein
VYGDSLKHCLVAVIVPDPANLKAFAEQTGISETEAVSGNKFKAAVL